MSECSKSDETVRTCVRRCCGCREKSGIEGPIGRALFDPAGHPVDRAGIVVDDAFRPVDITGKVVRPGLYAAGTILAHQDWLREKCGAGLAVATAWAAVAALAPKAGRTS